MNCCDTIVKFEKNKILHEGKTNCRWSFNRFIDGNDDTSEKVIQESSTVYAKNELLPIFQEPKCVNHLGGDKSIKVYKGYANRKQKKIRQLPNIFNDTSNASRSKHKLSRSLADLKRFINDINIEVTNNSCYNSTKLSLDDVIKANNTLHYLSTDEGSSYQEPFDSQLSVHEFPSEPVVDNINMQSINEKSKICKSNKLIKLKNMYSVNSDRRMFHHNKYPSEIEKNAIDEKKTVAEVNGEFSEKVKQTQNAFRAYYIRSMFNNHFIHKAKTIKEAKELYNTLKNKSSVENIKYSRSYVVKENCKDDIKKLYDTNSIELQRNDKTVHCFNKEIQIQDERLLNNFGNKNNSDIRLSGNMRNPNSKRIHFSKNVDKDKSYRKLAVLYENYSYNNNAVLKRNMHMNKTKFKNATGSKNKSKLSNISVLLSPGWSKLKNKLDEIERL